MTQSPLLPGLHHPHCPGGGCTGNATIRLVLVLTAPPETPTLSAAAPLAPTSPRPQLAGNTSQMLGPLPMARRGWEEVAAEPSAGGIGPRHRGYGHMNSDGETEEGPGLTHPDGQHRPLWVPAWPQPSAAPSGPARPPWLPHHSTLAMVGGSALQALLNSPSLWRVPGGPASARHRHSLEPCPPGGSPGPKTPMASPPSCPAHTQAHTRVDTCVHTCVDLFPHTYMLTQCAYTGTHTNSHKHAHAIYAIEVMHRYVHTLAYIYMSAHTCKQARARRHMHTGAPSCGHSREKAHTRAHTRTLTHTCTHMHTSTHTGTRLHTCVWSQVSKHLCTRARSHTRAHLNVILPGSPTLALWV